MKFNFVGNDKIGSFSIEMSRPVGDTCPTTCSALGNGCYRERSEKIFSRVRPSVMGNLVTDWNRLRAMFLLASAQGRPVRLHVGGDFMLDGKLDREYLANIRKACESITSRGGELPRIWVYTHVLRREVARLAEVGIAVYASVHNAADVRKARRAGFCLFALADMGGKIVPPAPRGGGNREARLNDWRDTLPRWVDLAGEKFLMCPEQRRGRGVVSCAGSPDSLACLWCVNGRGNVAFARH